MRAKTPQEKAEDAEFARAFSRLPRPVPSFADGVLCPWCGLCHESITFGSNNCSGCGRHFLFGWPNWSTEKEPLSFVEFPWKEWHATGCRADLFTDWKPNDRLKAIYHDMVECQSGITPNTSRPN